MGLSLYFNPTMIPRTITRKEWKEIWRWKRITQSELAKAMQREIDYLVVYGNTLLPEQKQRMIDNIVNPPLLLGPYMDKSHQ